MTHMETFISLLSKFCWKCRSSRKSPSQQEKMWGLYCFSKILNCALDFQKTTRNACWTLIVKLKQKALISTACPEISAIQTSAGHQKVKRPKYSWFWNNEHINPSGYAGQSGPWTSPSLTFSLSLTNDMILELMKTLINSRPKFSE